MLVKRLKSMRRIDTLSANSNRVKVAIIGCVGVPAGYGGFETLAEQLVLHASKNLDIHIYCSGNRYKERPSTFQSAQLHYVSLDANGVSSVPFDIWSMFHASRYADVMVVLGVSGCMFLPILRRICKATVLLNVDGIEWRRDKWGKMAKWFLEKSEGLGVRSADVVIADNLEIQRYVLERYGVQAACIAYGGDHAFAADFIPSDARLYPFIKDRYAVKVCRIEPENNVCMILEAFSRQQRLPLVVIGNWEGSEYGRQLRERFRHFDNLHLLDPIYDLEPLNKIRSNAWIYVHGHSAGGTNPSLVEAMWLGLAVLAFDVPYNRITTMDKAHYFDTADSLVEALGALDESSKSENAGAMRNIAEERYIWRRISDQYSEIITGGETDSSLDCT